MKKALVIIVVVCAVVCAYHIGIKIGKSECDMPSMTVETLHNGVIKFINPNPEIMETVYIFDNEEVTVYWE